MPDGIMENEAKDGKTAEASSHASLTSSKRGGPPSLFGKESGSMEEDDDHQEQHSPSPVRNRSDDPSPARSHEEEMAPDAAQPRQRDAPLRRKPQSRDGSVESKILQNDDERKGEGRSSSSSIEGAKGVRTPSSRTSLKIAVDSPAPVKVSEGSTLASQKVEDER